MPDEPMPDGPLSDEPLPDVPLSDGPLADGPLPDGWLPDEPRMLLRCGVLIDGTGAPAREDMAVVIEDGLVGAVTPWAARDQHSSDAVLDHSDATVVPGLVDGHTHLCWGSPQSRAWVDIGYDTAGVVAWGLSSCAAALAAGITTVVDCGSPSGLALTVRDLLRSGIATGPRVLAAAEAITTTAGHGADIGTPADDLVEIRTAVRRLVARSADLIKIMVTGGATDPHTNRRRAQYSTDELRAAIDDAHRLGRPVVGHANATEGIVSAVLAGIDVVAHCNWLGPDPGTVVVDLPTVERMARNGVFVDLNIQGARRPLAETDGEPVGWLDGSPRPGCRWDLLEPLRRAGVRMYLTSDAFGPAIGSFPTQLGCAGSEWSLTAEELIRSVTSVPALAFGLSDRGTIERGRAADVAAFRGDLRTDPSTLGRPAAVLQRGRLVAVSGMLSPPPLALAHAAQAQAQAGLLDEVFKELH